MRNTSTLQIYWTISNKFLNKFALHGFSVLFATPKGYLLQCNMFNFDDLRWSSSCAFLLQLCNVFAHAEGATCTVRGLRARRFPHDAECHRLFCAAVECCLMLSWRFTVIRVATANQISINEYKTLRTFCSRKLTELHASLADWFVRSRSRLHPLCRLDNYGFDLASDGRGHGGSMSRIPARAHTCAQEIRCSILALDRP